MFQKGCATIHLFIAFHLGFCLAGPTKCPFKDRRLYGYKEFVSLVNPMAYLVPSLLAVFGHKLIHSNCQHWLFFCRRLMAKVTSGSSWHKARDFG